MKENTIKLALRDAIAEQSSDYMGAIPTRREFLTLTAETLGVSLDTIIEVSARPEVATSETKGANRYGRVNYGEVAECIIKAWLGKTPTIASKNHEDFRINGERIEFKAVDRFSSPSSNHFRTRKTWILANSSEFSGLYSTTYDKLTFNSHKHLKLKGFENFDLLVAIKGKNK